MMNKTISSAHVMNLLKYEIVKTRTYLQNSLETVSKFNLQTINKISYAYFWVFQLDIKLITRINNQ